MPHHNGPPHHGPPPPHHRGNPHPHDGWGPPHSHEPDTRHFASFPEAEDEEQFVRLLGDPDLARAAMRLLWRSPPEIALIATLIARAYGDGKNGAGGHAAHAAEPLHTADSPETVSDR